MSGFEINFYSASQEFHRYSTDDFALLEIGVGNFNTSSLAKFLNLTFNNGSFEATERPINPDVQQFFIEAPTSLANKLIGTPYAGTMEILAFDEEDKVYRLKTGFPQIVLLNSNRYKPVDFIQPPAAINTFLDGWNKVQLGVETNKQIINGYKAVVNRIQNSLSGCILYDVDLNILGTPRKSKMRLSFLNTRDNESSKTISFNGSPFISALPQDAVGLKHSRFNTDNAPPGVYAPASNGNGGPQDMVGAQMRLAYDPATKTWESGTQQVLARLVDNIDAVNIPELSTAEMLSISAAATYDVPPEDNPWMGKSKTGRAIPLSTEDGNPNLYGPNFKGGCENTSNSVMVNAVNRSSKSFRAGRLVVLSFINGEWLIVGGEGDEVEANNIRFGNFEYQQYIIPAKYFFAVPFSAQRITPYTFISKYRDWFYLRRTPAENTTRSEYAPYVERGIMDPSSATAEWNETVNLNILASQIPSSQDPVQYLINNRTSSDLANLRNTAFLNTISIVSDTLFEVDRFFNTFFNPVDGYFQIDGYSKDLPTSYMWPTLEQDFAVPKNMLTRSAETLALNIPTLDFTDESQPNRWRVPLFWGALFPDGYKTAGTSEFLSNDAYGLKVGEIYAKDPTLAELSIAAAASFPYFKTEQELYNFLYSQSFRGNPKYIPRLYEFRAPQKTRKTGVFFTRSNHRFLEEKLGKSVWGLEPVQPKRIQFSPMSIDFLHTPSTLNDDFSYLKTSLSVMESSKLTVGGKTFSFKDYGEFLWNRDRTLDTFQDNYFIGGVFIGANSYVLKMLDYLSSFPFGADGLNPTATRHSSPTGTPNGNRILPNFPLSGGFQRSPIMPVIAIKSTIRTSAKGLRFTTNQRFGYVQQSIVSPGDGPEVTVLPIGGGLAWNTPATPVTVRSFPQWGDRSGRETYDSFGTTGLHVRVFESWPHKDTEYLGGIFTPLHYNDRVDNIFKVTYKINPDKSEFFENILNDEGLPSLVMSDVDFREPTFKTPTGGGTIMGAGAAVAELNLANFSDWKYNFIRRDKLLSGGGFAYVRRAIFVSSASLDPAGLQAAGGSGYSVGDKFVYPDGYTLEVTAIGEVTLPDGKVLEKSITGLKREANFADGFVKNINSYSSDIRSVSNVTPSYAPFGSSGGTGAMLKAFSFIIAKLIGYDPPPKEVVPITRVTQPSKRGEGKVVGILGTSVQFDETNKKEFDIFYFFQNDPATYALNGAYDDADAHYVISEVDPI